MEEEVICKYANHPACTNACNHSTEHEPHNEDEDQDEICTESWEYCHEVNEDVLCIPTDAYKFHLKMKEYKKTAKNILKGFEKI